MWKAVVYENIEDSDDRFLPNSPTIPVLDKLTSQETAIINDTATEELPLDTIPVLW